MVPRRRAVARPGGAAVHPARAGAVVTLVDADRPGAGVTANSFAWVGASGVRTGPAAGLRATATEEYRRLEAELPGFAPSYIERSTRPEGVIVYEFEGTHEGAEIDAEIAEDGTGFESNADAAG